MLRRDRMVSIFLLAVVYLVSLTPKECTCQIDNDNSKDVEVLQPQIELDEPDEVGLGGQDDEPSITQKILGFFLSLFLGDDDSGLFARFQQIIGSLISTAKGIFTG